MINTDALQAVDSSRLNDHFVKPLYESYCFSQIPATIVRLLTGEGKAGLPDSVLGELSRRYDKVILLFIDAFAWQFFERYQDKYPFLKRFVDEGVVSKLTSQFPFTTAAHTTTIHTGLSIAESGVFEWFYYEPLVDRIIAPLLFSFAGDSERNTLRKTDVEPQALYPQRTLYHVLAEHGVKSLIFQHRDYTPSPFSDVVMAGAQAVPYKTIAEAVVNLAAAVVHEAQKAYFFLYFAGIDLMGHTYGPESRQFEAEIDTFLSLLEKFLHDELRGKLSGTLLLVTADHGQIAVSPETTIYLNQMTPSVASFIRTNRQGKLLVPAGSARDMFLYLREEVLDEAHDLLARQLDGRAEVYRVADLLDQHFFGPGEPSPVFLNRVGNLVILPYAHETVWWYERGKFGQPFYGHHGGLSREEMETVLLALAYD